MSIKGIENMVVSGSAIAEVLAAEEGLPQPSPDRVRQLRAQYQTIANRIAGEVIRQHRARIGLRPLAERRAA